MAGDTSKTRLLIADDHRLVMEGIVRIVEPHCKIVGTVTTGRDVVTAAAELRPDIVLLDVAMPLLNGIEAARQLKRICPEVKIIFVTMQTNREYVREAFEVGASGYVLKQAAASDLIAAIRDIEKGLFFLSPMLSERFWVSSLPADQNPSKLFTELTPRQREVLQLVAEGKSAKEIAATLFISVKTVEFHKKHIMDELSVRNTAELIRFAVEKGWVAS